MEREVQAGAAGAQWRDDRDKGTGKGERRPLRHEQQREGGQARRRLQNSKDQGARASRGAASGRSGGGRGRASGGARSAWGTVGGKKYRPGGALGDEGDVSGA